MKQYEFLRALSRKLWWCGPEEADEIVDDYREHFQAGMADGKTEEALCAEFGDPADIVRALRGEQGGRPWLRVAALAASAFWILAFLFRLDSIEESLRMSYLLLIPPLMYYGAGFSHRRAAPAGKRTLMGLFAVLCFYNAAVAVAMGPLYANVRDVSQWWDAFLRRTFHQQFGWAVDILLLSAAVAAVAACVLAFCLWRGARHSYLIPFLCAGYLICLGEWNGGFWEALFYPESFPAPYVWGLEQVFTALLLAIAFGWALRMCAGRERARWTGPMDSLAGRAIRCAVLILLGLWTVSIAADWFVPWQSRFNSLSYKAWLLLYVLGTPVLLRFLLRRRLVPENAFSVREKRSLLLMDLLAVGCFVLAAALVLACTPVLGGETRPLVRILQPYARMVGPFVMTTLKIGGGMLLAAAGVKLLRLPDPAIFPALALEAGGLSALREMTELLRNLNDPEELLASLCWSLLPFALGAAAAVWIKKRDARTSGEG